MAATPARNPAIAGLSSHLFDDTTGYGGTFWAPDSMRWEAIRDSHWSFDSGVGSWINNGSNPNKPVGYHQGMEGWLGVDVTIRSEILFRRSSVCAIAGSFSMWAGITLTEGNARCWASGQGYGNGWNEVIARSFSYGGSGSVAFSFQYAVESEPFFDYAYAWIDTTGTGAADDLTLWSEDGTRTGTATFTLNPGQKMRSSSGSFLIKFGARSDGSYSDEDALYPTFCGMLVVDNVLVGANLSTFESGTDGWTTVVATTGVGDLSDLRHLADLEPQHVLCPCNLRDSVLVFNDTNGGHPLDQDNFAISPWIDLLANGDVGRPGRLLMFDIYAELPIVNHVLLQLKARYYPEVCDATGLLIRSPFRDTSSYFEFGQASFCTSLGAPYLHDFSSVVNAGAEQVQVAWGVVNLCRTEPFGFPCSGITNPTPYFDNLSFGVYGSAFSPLLTTTPFDRFQDNFAADGTLNVASPGRFDQNRLKGTFMTKSGTILGDTLIARGDGGNTEVRLVFRVGPGPFVNPITLASYVARWTSEPTLNARYGGAWYSARMDTAEQNGFASTPLAWMGAFHEADPGFTGTDRTVDAYDPNRLANDIIPDHLFTPGSRLDYFVAARYRPPDPRNPGGTNWATDPDTTNAYFREAEILPSSMAADSTWNCVLYVDHHDDRDSPDQYLEEQGLRLALGPGGTNAEGTKHDRFDVQTPSSAQMSFGRPLATKYGASVSQALGYKAIAWHGATLTSGVLTNEDAAILGPWLTLRTIGNNHFWGSGEGLVQSMQATGGQARTFMQNTLGTLQSCTAIRLALCGGSGIDTTYCLPTSGVAGSHFASTILPRARGNGCPELMSFDRLSVNGAVATAKGQLHYLRLVPGPAGTPTDVAYASVTNHNTVDVTYRTVLDGISVGRMRANPGGFDTGCDDFSASYARTADILAWFQEAARCRITANIVDVPPPVTPTPGFRHTLGAAYPNPMSPSTRIAFTNGIANGRVTIDLFDVTGRRVRRLVNGPMPAGTHEITWDRRGDGGAPVASGLYFYQMTADGFADSRKLVVID